MLYGSNLFVEKIKLKNMRAIGTQLGLVAAARNKKPAFSKVASQIIFRITQALCFFV